MSSSPSSPLSHRINTATRPAHSRLNTLILSLLPLALPPHASNPTLYAKGIAQILPIYEAFEGALRLLFLRAESCEEAKEGRRTVVEELMKLWIPELERAGRLRRDSKRLYGGSSYVTGEAALKLEAFTRHISSSTEIKPHLLLAYTWLLYMALFSGGRYIRARLREAGTGFWAGAENEKGGDIDDFLSFWTFEGQEDGGDIQAEFKQRFAGMEGYLTGQEREEIVQEATYVMDTMMEVVKEIAQIVEREDPRLKAAGRSLASYSGVETDEPSLRWLGLKHILPMGMFELITGVSKAVMMGIEPLYGKV